MKNLRDRDYSFLSRYSDARERDPVPERDPFRKRDPESQMKSLMFEPPDPTAAV